MIRQASQLGRLLTNPWGREVAVLHGFQPRLFHLYQFDVKYMSMPSSVIFRMFSVTKKLKDDKAVLLSKMQTQDAKILSLNSVDEILNAAVSEFDVDSFSLLLKRLAALRFEDPVVYDLEKDARFTKLTGTLAERASELNSSLLIDSLHCLLQLTKEDTDAINKLEKQVKDKLLRFSFSQLLRVVQMHKASCDTNLRQSMLEEAMKILERRWVEIKHAKDLVSVYYLAPNEKEKLLSNLEEKALELSESMNAKDLYRFLYLMAKRNRRNAPVIQSLVYHMNRFTLSLNSVHLANLSYACAKLRIYDSKLMTKIIEGVLQCRQDDASTIVALSTVLHSLGLLRWRDTSLMDGAAEKFLAQGVSLPINCWSTLLMTAGCVNYLPSALEKVLSDVTGRLGELQKSDPRLWLNVVWSAAALSVATSSMLSSVLSADFLRAVKEVHTSQNLVPAYLKLLNINAFANCCMPDYRGNLLSDTTVQEIAKEVPALHCGSLNDCLLDTLSNMANLGKYTRTNVKTLAGYSIDVVLITNSSGELQPIELLKDSDLSTVALPQNLHKIAVQLLEFSDMTHGISSQPTGRSSLEARLMSTAGYKVIQVPFSDFNMTMTVVQRVQYLNAKLKEALSGSEQEHQGSISQQTDAMLKTSTQPSRKSSKVRDSATVSEPSQLKKHEMESSLNKKTRKKSPERLEKLSMKDLLQDSQPQ